MPRTREFQRDSLCEQPSRLARYVCASACSASSRLELDGDTGGAARRAAARARCSGCSRWSVGMHSRSELAARFWPDVLDESARTSLRSALSALRRVARARRPIATWWRRASASAWPATSGPTRTEFERHRRRRPARRRRSSSYRGDLLTGLDDDWVLDARDEWRERVAGVLGDLAAGPRRRRLAGGDRAHPAERRARPARARRRQRALIRRLAAGRRPRRRARRRTTATAERLRSELRIAPSPATRALVEELRSGERPEPAPRAGGATPSAARPWPPLPGPSRSCSPTSSAPPSSSTSSATRRPSACGKVHFALLRDVALSHARPRGEERSATA